MGFLCVCVRKKKKDKTRITRARLQRAIISISCVPRAQHFIREWMSGSEDSDGGQRDDPDKRRAEWPASKLSLLELCGVVTRPRRRDETIPAAERVGRGMICRGRIAVMALFISVISRERDVGQVASSADESSSAGSLWRRGR